ncbi:hypothetical protein Skr01_22170 [Sphaerisporangium krabiense]|nr:hypothetical protein Skr01_22170 [Sphaerisporangium krabiense]
MDAACQSWQDDRIYGIRTALSGDRTVQLNPNRGRPKSGTQALGAAARPARPAADAASCEVAITITPRGGEAAVFTILCRRTGQVGRPFLPQGRGFGALRIPAARGYGIDHPTLATCANKSGCAENPLDGLYQRLPGTPPPSPIPGPRYRTVPRRPPRAAQATTPAIRRRPP